MKALGMIGYLILYALLIIHLPLWIAACIILYIECPSFVAHEN